MNKDMVSIIIPAKDEPYLQQLITHLNLYLPNTSHEIIVVTSDRSKNTLPQLPPDIKIFKSYGDSLERSILLGFSVAEGTKIIVMDADGSHPPELIPQMIKDLDDYEMVIANRFDKESHYHTSLPRLFVTFIFNEYAKLLGNRLSDPMSGFFGIQTQLLEKIKFRPYKWKLALEICNKLHPNVKEIPFTFNNRVQGKSKSNWKVGLKIFWDILVDVL